MLPICLCLCNCGHWSYLAIHCMTQEKDFLFARSYQLGLYRNELVHNVTKMWSVYGPFLRHGIMSSLKIIEMEVKSNNSITLNDFIIFVSQHTALSCHRAVYNSLSISTVAVSLCFDNKWRRLCFEKDQWNKQLSAWRLAAKKHILLYFQCQKDNKPNKVSDMDGWMDGLTLITHTQKTNFFWLSLEFEVSF